MVNYNKAIIYKIVPKDLDSKYCYIGSTVDFKKRKSQHKSMCNNPKDIRHNTPLYKHIRDGGGWEEYEMVLVEYYPCETKLELCKRERECKEIYNDNLGCYIPSRTGKEYYQDNHETIIKKVKEYYEDNKEKISKKCKEYREKNKEKIAEKKKEYYEDNKEKRVEKMKEHYQNNKEYYKKKKKEYYEKNKEKIECPTCKCYIRKDAFKRHTRTKKHQSNL